MHGLINRSIQSFLRETYGQKLWEDVVQRAEFKFDDFEALLIYPAEQTDAMIEAACAVMRRRRGDLLESLGTYLVTSPNLEALRRLLRFGGLSFVDFLHSLDDLPDRAHLALSELDLPELIVLDQGSGHFRLLCAPLVDGAGHIIVGLLRAMADDYGALVLLDHLGTEGNYEVVAIQVLDQAYTAGKQFDLALPVGPER